MPPNSDEEATSASSSSARTWSKYARHRYDPVKVGSIDGTDEFPHDRALVRAMNSSYKPNHKVTGDPHLTVFVGRLEHSVSEDRIRELFGRCGTIVSCRLVRDVVTGISRGYAFVQYTKRRYVERALEELHGRQVDGKEILVDEEWERRLEGWKPRRLGGGFGGRKKSQQLRFGCKDRPWMRPVVGTSEGEGQKYSSRSDFHRNTNKQRELLSTIEYKV